MQGNIIAILDSNGNLIVKYRYDAWGNHKVLDASGNVIIDASHIGNLNPFRYRSYYFDTETKLYFLKTRYYDPEVGRFINMDSIDYADPEKINGLNLYAYCNNNPVMNVDPEGTWSWGKFGEGVGRIALGIGAVVAGALVLASGVAGIFIEGKMNNKTIFNELIGNHLSKIFKQMDLLIINFNNPITLSLHVACMVRIYDKHNILLTSSDEFFTTEGFEKEVPQYEYLQDQGYINDPNCLLSKNLDKVNKLLYNKKVKNIVISKWMDLKIIFENGIVIQILPDCLMCNFEYYRIIDFEPYLDDDFNNYKSNHYVVCNVKGKPTLKKE